MLYRLTVREEGDEERYPIRDADSHEDSGRDQETSSREDDGVEVEDRDLAGDCCNEPSYAIRHEDLIQG